MYDPQSYFLYFGIFIGILLIEGRNNLPNTKDVFIGKRIGNTLHFHTHKLVKKGAEEIKYNKRLLPLIDSETNVYMKHLSWESIVHFIDEDWGSDIIGIQQKYEDKSLESGKEIDIEAMDKEIKDTLAKGKPAQIKMNINPIFMISAVKLYNWFYVKMLNAAYDSIVKKLNVRGGVLTYVLLGVVVGGMGGYIVTTHIEQANLTTITNTQFVTCPSTNLTETTSTAISTLPQECITSLLSSISSHSSSSTTSLSSATVQQITSFTNGTVYYQYSNGTRVCEQYCPTR